ncbi:MAG: class I SAM-dependent methyltransferase [Gammaproteobacteria bacterium]|nr:MAG: class I SAM-dependent methyltransferase [Gammaproteobacteria bacterium]
MSSSFNSAYVGCRPDIQALMPERFCRVLDLGCSDGSLGRSIKENHPGAEIVGIEIDELMAAVAECRLDRVLCADLESFTPTKYFSAGYFDVIILADVLEHLREPWTLLAQLKNILHEQGRLIVSVPNVRFYETIFQLVVRGDWPFRPRGIHDRTHLRFFTRKSLLAMLDECGYEKLELEKNFRIFEQPRRLNRLGKLFRWFPGNDLFVYQYLAVCRKKRGRDAG